MKRGRRLIGSCLILYLPSANEVCEGYVFTCVCHSLHRAVSRPRLRGCHGLGVSRPRPRGSRPRARSNPGSGADRGVQAQAPGGVCVCIPACTEADTQPADSYCCRRYASYWNAFMLSIEPHSEILCVSEDRPTHGWTDSQKQALKILYF